MATHVGTSGVVKVGSATVAEVTGFTLNETQDTVEDTALTDSKKSYIALRGDATATIEWYPEGTDSGDAYYNGTGIVTGADVAVTMDGIISRTLNIQFTGGVTHSTV